MAKAVTLKNNNDEEVYPVTDISLVNGELNGVRIVNASVGSDKLTPNAVWNENIKDRAVTSNKIDWTTLSGDEWPLINTTTSNNNINNKDDYVQYSFTVPASGRYFVSFTHRLGSDAANGYGLTVKVKLDSTTIDQSGAAITGNASYMYATVACVVSAKAGQVIACTSTGGSTNSATTMNGRVSLARIA